MHRKPKHTPKRTRPDEDPKGRPLKCANSTNKATMTEVLVAGDQSMAVSLHALSRLHGLLVSHGGEDADVVLRSVVLVGGVYEGASLVIESVTKEANLGRLAALSTDVLDVRLDAFPACDPTSLHPSAGAAEVFHDAMRRLLNVGQWMLAAGKSTVFPSFPRFPFTSSVHACPIHPSGPRALTPRGCWM